MQDQSRCGRPRVWRVYVEKGKGACGSQSAEHTVMHIEESVTREWINDKGEHGRDAGNRGNQGYFSYKLGGGGIFAPRF